MPSRWSLRLLSSDSLARRSAKPSARCDCVVPGRLPSRGSNDAPVDGLRARRAFHVRRFVIDRYDVAEVMQLAGNAVQMQQATDNQATVAERRRSAPRGAIVRCFQAAQQLRQQAALRGPTGRGGGAVARPQPHSAAGRAQPLGGGH